MRRTRGMYAIIALVLTIVIEVGLNTILTVLNQPGTMRIVLDMPVCMTYFVVLYMLIETLHKVIKKVDFKFNITLLIMLVACVVTITIMLIGLFSTLGNRIVILIIFCASFLLFIGMGANAIHIEKSK